MVARRPVGSSELSARPRILDVRTGHEVVAIEREAKQVRVVERETGRTYHEHYDRLVLATGATPLKPPLPGIDHPRIFTLRSIPDMDAIKAVVDGGARSAVVVGGVTGGWT